MQANLIMGGGPHIKARVTSDAGGKCFMHMSCEMKPCVAKVILHQTKRGGASKVAIACEHMTPRGRSTPWYASLVHNKPTVEKYGICRQNATGMHCN